MPRFTCGQPKKPVSDMMRMSDSSAKPAPCARQGPLIAAMIGLSICRMRMYRSSVPMASASMSPMPIFSYRSCPAQKAVPWPVRIASQTSGLSRTSSRHSPNSLRIREVIALRASGRSKVMRAMRSDTA